MTMLRRTTRLFLALLLVVLVLGTTAVERVAAEDKGNPGAAPAQAARTISGEPLSIAITDGLAMAVEFNGRNQFFADFDSGTFLEVDGRVFGAEPFASGSFSPIPYTLVSNPDPSGRGTEANPFKIVTVVQAGRSGLQLMQTTTYVDGENRYQNTYTLTNMGTVAKSLRLFHAADLYLNFPDNRADFGFGFYDPDTGAIGALSEDEQNVQVFIPITEPTASQEAFYTTLWSRIGGASGTPGPGFDNSVNLSFHDVAAGLQWNRTVAPGESITISHYGAFGLFDDDDDDEGDVDSSSTLVSVSTNPNISVQPGGIFTCTILVRNIGEGDADNVTATMPFDPAKVQVVDAAFSQDTAWVSQLNGDNLVFETGRIQENGGVVTATVRLRALPGVPAGAGLGARVTIKGNGVEVERERSNLVPLVVGTTSVNQPFYPLAVAPASAPAGSNFTFASTIFIPNEPVTFWYNTPTGASFEITRVDADDEGTVNETFISAPDLPGGTYTMVAYGNWSKLTATTTFVVQGGSGDGGGES